MSSKQKSGSQPSKAGGKGTGNYRRETVKPPQLSIDRLGVGKLVTSDGTLGLGIAIGKLNRSDRTLTFAIMKAKEPSGLAPNSAIILTGQDIVYLKSADKSGVQRDAETRARHLVVKGALQAFQTTGQLHLNLKEEAFYYSLERDGQKLKRTFVLKRAREAKAYQKSSVKDDEKKEEIVEKAEPIMGLATFLAYPANKTFPDRLRALINQFKIDGELEVLQYAERNRLDYTKPIIALIEYVRMKALTPEAIDTMYSRIRGCGRKDDILLFGPSQNRKQVACPWLIGVKEADWQDAIAYSLTTGKHWAKRATVVGDKQASGNGSDDADDGDAEWTSTF